MDGPTAVAASTAVEGEPTSATAPSSGNGATTISTIAVRAEPHTTIVIAMLKSIGLSELRIDEMTPKLLDIGSSIEETSSLLQSHNDLFTRLASKQDQVEGLLARADELVAEQSEPDDVIVYEAMADGLGVAWRELTRQLELRGFLLQDTLSFYQMAEKHEHLTKESVHLVKRALTQAAEGPLTQGAPVLEAQKSISELIGLTMAAVDAGSSLIAQIRLLGSLADNDERAGECLKACLEIETRMLRMAQQWEMIDGLWASEREKFGPQSAPHSSNAPAHLSKRIAEFIRGAESMLLQLGQMDVDLRNAQSPSMAGELGPLAHQKTGPLIEEGEQLLPHAPSGEVGELLAQLKGRLAQLIDSAKERIEKARNGNGKLKGHLAALTEWLSGIESSLDEGQGGGRMGVDVKGFAEEHRRLAEAVVGREAEAVSLLSQTHQLPAHDRQQASDFQQRYESVRSRIDNRLQLTRTYEQFNRFAKEMDLSCEKLEGHLKSGGDDGGGGLGEEVAKQIRNVYQLLQETLQREKHEGDKFIAKASASQSTDPSLQIGELISVIRHHLQGHQQRMADLSTQWEQWEESRRHHSQMSSGPPRLLGQLSEAGEVRVEEGGRLELRVPVEAHPPLTLIRWTMDGVEVQSSAQCQKGYLNGAVTLTIPKASPNDSAVYELRVENSEGAAETAARVVVQAPSQMQGTVEGVKGQKPLFVQPLQAATVAEGETAVLDCVLVGEPEPQVLWMREEEILRESERIQLHFRGDHCSLSIANVSVADSGLYRIKGVNVLGESTSFCRLNVASASPSQGQRGKQMAPAPPPKPTTPIMDHHHQRQYAEHSSHQVITALQQPQYTPPPPIPQHKPFDLKAYVDREMEAAGGGGDFGYSSLANAPQFIRPFQSEYVLEEGERVKLDCLMVGNPRPRIQWTFNSRPLQSDYRFVELLNVGDTYSIVMGCAGVEHSGLYHMVAENVRGKTECSTLIHVRPRQQSQLITPRQHSLEAPGAPLISRSVYSASASSEYTSSPPPPQQQRASSVTAAAGMRKDSGRAPHFIQTLVSSVIAEGEPASFEAVVSGSPEPSIEWSKDGVPIGIGGGEQHMATPTNTNGRVALKFEKATLDLSAKYTCRATNSSGVATSSAQLVVRPKTTAPDFTQRLISEEAEEGQRLVWIVKIRGDPEPTVTWLRDSQPIPNCEEVRLVRNAPGVYSMVIERLEMADAGQFTCQLENISGEARSTADLVVRPAGAEPGSYVHVTKVTQEKKIGGEESQCQQTVSIQEDKVAGGGGGSGNE